MSIRDWFRRGKLPVLVVDLEDIHPVNIHHDAIHELYEIVEKQAEQIESLQRSQRHTQPELEKLFQLVAHALRMLGYEEEQIIELQEVILLRTIVSVAFEFSGETDMSTINVTVNVTRASGATGPLLASDNVTIAVTSGSSVYTPNTDPSTGVLSNEVPGENETLTATAADGTVLGTGTVGWGVPPDPVASVNFAFEEVQ